MLIQRQGDLRPYRRARTWLVATSILASGLAAPALAQDMSATPPPPVDATLDRNGIDLGARQPTLRTEDISIGNETSGMTYSRFWNGSGWRDNFTTSMATTSSGGYQTTTLSYGNTSEQFSGNAAVGFTPLIANGSELSYDFTNSRYVWMMASGRKIIMPSLNYWSDPFADSVNEVIEPDGEVIKLTYRSAPTQPCTPGAVCVDRTLRLQSATSSAGYQVKFEYERDDASNLSNAAIRKSWLTVTKVTLVNNAVDYCNPSADHCAFSRVWPSASYASNLSGTNTLFTVTDALGRATRYTISNAGRLLAVKRPSSSSDNVTYTYAGGGRISQVNQGGDIWNYNFFFDWPLPEQTTITDPGQNTRTVLMAGAQPLSVEDSLGNITKYQPIGDGQYASIEMPEGNRIDNSFDTRRNITQTVRTAKPGSGVASITTSAVFPATCGNPLTCNKPDSTTDAKGNVTDYTYDPVHGGLLTVTAPAPTPGGVRPQTRYSYAALYAWYKNGAGVLVQAPTPIHRLTGISRCQTTASCAGTADEVKTTIAYGTSGTANNLLPTSVTTGAGDGSLSATSTFTYDEVGNRLTVDGPLSGTADTVRTRYDDGRQVVGVIGPDPDGAGGYKHQAQRFSYNADGQLTIAESGTVDSQSDGDWAAFVPAETVTATYDAKGRKIKDVLSSGGTDHAMTQYGYNSRDLLTCSAQRMDPAQWAGQSDSCTPQLTGPNGPDRVEQRAYDALGRVVDYHRAFGTADASHDYVSFTGNGQVEIVTDGKGNKTTYEYDGHDRLAKTRYPDPSTAWASSTTDYEALGYDAGSNLTSLRKRDGRTIAFGYDALNRVTSKTYPNGGARPVYYAYDLRGLPTAARFDSPSGSDAVLSEWDGLGRQVSVTTSLGGVSRALGYQYDATGNRTRITYPDGHFFASKWDSADRLIYSGVDGLSVGLIHIAYTATGQPWAVYRYDVGASNWASPTEFTYDGAQRLSSYIFPQSLTGGANAVTSFAYNPAGQITSRTRNDDDYRFTGYANADRGYAINGLNQVTGTGGGSFAYDANGNLTSDGVTGYSYDIENRLVGTSAGVTLSYDPLGRLAQTSSPTTGTTQFLYDGDALVAEYDGAGAMLKRYVHGPGVDNPVAEYVGSGVTAPRYLFADHQGSIVAIANAGGNRIQANSYDEYGVPGAANAGRFQYTGQTWIPELGMYHYKARVYNPVLGRFMQTDPVGYGDGLNLYAYVGGDPVNFTDPTGTQDDAVITGQRWQNSGAGGMSATGFVTTYPDDPETVNIVRFKKRERYAAVSGGLPQNGLGMAAKMSDEERERAAEADAKICRMVKTAECWASAAERDAARVKGKPVPPLRTGSKGSWSPQRVGAGLGALAIIGGVVCLIAEPCGAAVAAGLGLGGTAVLLTN